MTAGEAVKKSIFDTGMTIDEPIKRKTSCKILL